MKNSQPAVSPAVEAKWLAHADELGYRYMQIMGYVVLVTFCGGITASLIARGGFTPVLVGLIGTTAFAVILGMILHKFRKISNELLGYIAYFGMATTISYLIAQGDRVENILGQVPVFLASGLIFFWKTKHSIVCLVYNIVIGWIFLAVFSVQPVSVWINWWSILFPMGLGMVLLIRFKYHAWRKNFLFSRQLEETNEELMRSYEVIHEKQHLLEKKDRQTMASLQYAKRIQQALLPYEERMTAVFPKHFVLFQPKDVVSGDFYWMQEKDGKVYFALVDCTGHGIPGGFMSMIGHALLDSIVLEKGLTNPSDVLLALASGIRKALQQDHTDSHDGMDISFCAFDFQQKELLFAGAKQTLIYIQDGQMKTVKGDRAYIGGHIEYTAEKFTTHRVSLEKPTYIYLSSDGYYDQFGGQNQKKILSKRFRELLFDIHTLPMEEQRSYLRKYLATWKREGQEKQTDDILVVGLYLEVGG